MRSILVLAISANHTEVRVLQSILREQSEGEVAIVGSADRGEEALSRSLALRPQVILANLDRAEEGALEIISRLCGLVPEAGIVALIPRPGASTRRWRVPPERTLSSLGPTWLPASCLPFVMPPGRRNHGDDWLIRALRNRRHE